MIEASEGSKSQPSSGVSQDTSGEKSNTTVSVRLASPTARTDSPTQSKEEEEEKYPDEMNAVPKRQKSDKVFVAFARIFSGTLKAGQKVHILGPRYDPKHPDKYRTGTLTISTLMPPITSFHQP